MAAGKPPSPKPGFAVALGSKTIADSERQLKRVRKHYIFRGYVQRRGFRMTSWHFAKEQRVTGWVYNRPDGAVEMEAQGEPGRLWRFHSLLLSLEGVIGERDEEIPVVDHEDSYLILVQKSSL